MEVGKKYKIATGFVTSTIYTVIYTDDKGALVEWTNDNTYRAWVVKETFHQYKEHIEYKEITRWVNVYIYDNTNVFRHDDFVHISKEQARLRVSDSDGVQTVPVIIKVPTTFPD